ncbi:MAG: calcium/sodium antiporter [Verrucomicrobiales bacterium]
MPNSSCAAGCRHRAAAWANAAGRRADGGRLWHVDARIPGLGEGVVLGQSDIAIGNVIGSNLFNVAVILAVSAMVCPIATNLQVLRWDAPIMVAVSLAAFGLARDGEISRAEGIAFVAGAILYTAAAIRLARRDLSAGREPQIDVPEIEKPKGSALRDIALILGGLGLLALGARVLVDNAVSLARGFGVSEVIIGLTIVAAGTSVPELATSVVAALRRQPDIALGNVLGSNLFNILFVLGASGAIHPVKTSGAGILDWAFMLGTSAALVPFLYTGKRLSRPEGAILAASYGVYLFLLWPK